MADFFKKLNGVLRDINNIVTPFADALDGSTSKKITVITLNQSKQRKELKRLCLHQDFMRRMVTKFELTLESNSVERGIEFI